MTTKLNIIALLFTNFWRFIQPTEEIKERKFQILWRKSAIVRSYASTCRFCFFYVQWSCLHNRPVIIKNGLGAYLVYLIIVHRFIHKLAFSAKPIDCHHLHVADTFQLSVLLYIEIIKFVWKWQYVSTQTRKHILWLWIKFGRLCFLYNIILQQVLEKEKKLFCFVFWNKKKKWRKKKKKNPFVVFCIWSFSYLFLSSSTLTCHTNISKLSYLSCSFELLVTIRYAPTILYIYFFTGEKNRFFFYQDNSPSTLNKIMHILLIFEQWKENICTSI